MSNGAVAGSRGHGRLLVVALVALSGCYVTAPIKPSELVLLDGYKDGEPKGGGPVSVLSPSNQPTEIVGNSKIYLELPSGTYGGTFKSIQVKDGVFNGVTDDGSAMQVPISSIKSARVKETNRAAMGPLYALSGAVIFLGLLSVFFLATMSPGPPNPVGGRALRVARRPIAAPAVGGEGWQTGIPLADPGSLSPPLRDALARLWTESARAEHASVPAFSRLALSLVAFGAPAGLVEAAHRAALEEIEHARLAFSLASAYAGAPVGPGSLPELGKARAVTATTLAELAAQSLIDGCLLEGVAAEVARRALFRARDRRAREVLVVIARDEASHAELAWDVLDWCRERGGDSVERRLAAALDGAPASVTAPGIPEPLADALADHGWVGPAVWEEAFHCTAKAVAARVASRG